MTDNIFGHTVERIVNPDGYDGSIAYECERCGIRGIKLPEFESNRCDNDPRQ